MVNQPVQSQGPKQRGQYRGVSGRRGIPPRIVQTTGGAFPGFANHGGPVITSPTVYTSFWGPLWQTDQHYQTLTGQLNQYHADLLQSNFMNMLSQYGVGTGAGSGTFVNQPTVVSNVPTALTLRTIQSTIQSLIDQQFLPEPVAPGNNVLMIYLDETLGVKDPAHHLVLCESANDNAFGFHQFFTTTAGNPCYFAIVPVLADACLRETCSNDAHCSLHLSQKQLDRITQVASHEFAEMCTDPQLTGWYDLTDTDLQGHPVGENGDICNGEANAITVGANTWGVQKIYSKTDDLGSGGTNFCVSQSPNPLPVLQ